MIECEGQFGIVIKCNKNAEIVVNVAGQERYACKNCGKGFKVIARIVKS